MKGKVTNMQNMREIIHRLRMNQSQRQIQREIGIHRSIIREVYNLAITQEWLKIDKLMPSNEEIANIWRNKEKVLSHPLDLYKEEIKRWHEEGLSSIVIQQLLKDKYPCDVQVIRRYRSKHFPKAIEPVMVRSTIPGDIMEVDFGELGRFLDDDLSEKRVWLFSLRLRHSRKVYREIVFDQTLQTFLMGHVHAFEYFNGVPKCCVIDNLKAGVIKSTIDNDMLNRSYQELAEYYGFVISPCLPRTPNHKGGVEGDIKYVKKNFLAYFWAYQRESGIVQSKISDLKEALVKWEREVADIHIVYGVGKSPLEIFNSEESGTLKPLPKSRWQPTHWSQSTVRKDWRVMVNNAYYSVPHQLIGQTVEVCTTDLFVRIFYNHKEVALHEKATKKWDYKRKTEHAPPFQEAVLQCTREGLLVLAGDIGISTRQLAEGILSHPSVDKLKPVRHLLNLANKYSKERLEKACQRALSCKMFSYASVKNILENNLDSQPLEDVSKPKIIPIQTHRFARDPNDYKSSYKETFEEKLLRMHPYSKYGNAMMGVYQGLLADQMIDEEKGIYK